MLVNNNKEILSSIQKCNSFKNRFEDNRARTEKIDLKICKKSILPYQSPPQYKKKGESFHKKLLNFKQVKESSKKAGSQKKGNNLKINVQNLNVIQNKIYHKNKYRNGCRNGLVKVDFISNKATPQINQNRDIIHCINNSQQLNEKNSLNSSPNLNSSNMPNEDLNEILEKENGNFESLQNIQIISSQDYECGLANNPDFLNYLSSIDNNADDKVKF